MNRLKRILPLIISLYGFIAAGQNAEIKGKLVDAGNGETLPGAAVLLEPSGLGGLTDPDGVFFIRNIKPGKYSLTVKCISYTSSTVRDVEIKQGVNDLGTITLESMAKELSSVEITARKVTHTGKAVLMEMKESRQLVNGISSEQMTRSQDRDASQAIQRVPGVTAIGNKFVMIRGVSDRYNAVLINNTAAPGTEVDRRSFAFDLIPTNLLDRMLVYKSGAAELPGDFAGGVIKIYTSGIPEENSVSAGLSTGYRPGTTFQPYYSTQCSNTDLLGFDNGFRQLPSGFFNNLNTISPEKVEILSRTVPNNYTIGKSTAYPDLRFNVRIAKKFRLGKAAAGNITSVNYGTSYQYTRSERTRYLELDESLRSSPLHSKYIDDQYSRNVRIGVLSNFSVSAGKSLYEFKNMFNQLGENETTIRNGISYYQRPEDSLRNYSFRYTSRSIYSGQISGQHELGDRSTIDWVGGVSYVDRNVPDLRRLRTYKKIGLPGDYKVIIPSGATTFDAARFYSDLREFSVSHGVNAGHKLYDPAKDSAGIVIRAGYFIEYKDRSFNAKWMSYKSMNNQVADSLSALPIDQIFLPSNISITRGLFLAEGTNPSDRYEAQNSLTAGYGSISLPLGRFSIAAGLRAEFNRMSLQSATALYPVSVNNPVLSILPFINISYSFTEKELVRAAYGKTVNRPEFREIAPFLFYDFDYNFDVVGNPGVRSADIHNFDLRYEIYPSHGETFSAGIFYKRFINPIENYIRQGADNPIYTFGNAVYAENYGIETEVRKSLGNVSGAELIKNLSLVFNAAFIRSRVDLGGAVTSQDAVRPLQGQSPYLVNAGVYYSSADNDWSISLLYNVIGKRIFIVGDRVNPTIYEMPRHVFDFTATRRIFRNMEARIGVQDLLNSAAMFFQDSDLDNRISSSDEPVLSYRKGSYWTFGLNCNF
jgi:hypothetical protein